VRSAKHYFASRSKTLHRRILFSTKAENAGHLTTVAGNAQDRPERRVRSGKVCLSEFIHELAQAFACGMPSSRNGNECWRIRPVVDENLDRPGSQAFDVDAELGGGPNGRCVMDFCAK
jgi:hypothetical protein